MLITKHFVFVHLQKTGGSFVQQMCERHLPPGWLVPNDLGDHASFHQIPPQYKHLPVFALVRNPWDWYVSWYHFTVQKPVEPADEAPDSIWVQLFDRGRRDFRAAVTAACEGISATAGPPPPYLLALQNRDWDLYTLWYWMLVGRGVEEGRLEVGRSESLREDFVAFLGRHRIPVDEEFLAAVRTAPLTNPSRHGDYRSYYDPALRDLVAHKARLIVERYRYSF